MTTPIILILASFICLVGVFVLLAQASTAGNVDGKTAGVPSVGTLPKDTPADLLRRRLIHAGLYRRHSTFYFYLTQAMLAVIPVFVGFAAYTYGLYSLRSALIIGAITGIAGVVLPGLWLDYQKATRQTMIRRSIPDALDIATICVEAGLSLNAALVRVAKDLRTTYPMLSTELTIVNRQIQMGKSTGEALRSFAERFDLEELRLLASVVMQSERFGASIASALRVQGDSLRTRRMQRAQEKAQTATLKILFPTALCIFPSIFVVILGPAVFDLIELLRKMNAG